MRFADEDWPSSLEYLACIRMVARRCGYTIAIHGSMSKDLDLIAVPWTEAVSKPEELLREISNELGNFVRLEPPEGSPRPFGRRAWSLLLPGRTFYFDLSVISPQGEDMGNGMIIWREPESAPRGAA